VHNFLSNPLFSLILFAYFIILSKLKFSVHWKENFLN
jgi:hypothetical protein